MIYLILGISWPLQNLTTKPTNPPGFDRFADVSKMENDLTKKLRCLNRSFKVLMLCRILYYQIV